MGRHRIMTAAVREHCARCQKGVIIYYMSSSTLWFLRYTLFVIIFSASFRARHTSRITMKVSTSIILCLAGGAFGSGDDYWVSIATPA